MLVGGKYETAAKRAADNAYNNSRYYTVGIEGYENDHEAGLGPFGDKITAEQLGRYILNNTDNPWDQSKPIQLLQCYSAKGNFAADLAQYLADKTGNAVTVIGSQDAVVLKPHGIDIDMLGIHFYWSADADPGPSGWQTIKRNPAPVSQASR
jgi:hypothetical protein